MGRKNHAVVLIEERLAALDEEQEEHQQQIDWLGKEKEHLYAVLKGLDETKRVRKAKTPAQRIPPAPDEL